MLHLGVCTDTTWRQTHQSATSSFTPLLCWCAEGEGGSPDRQQERPLAQWPAGTVYLPASRNCCSGAAAVLCQLAKHSIAHNAAASTGRTQLLCCCCCWCRACSAKHCLCSRPLKPASRGGSAPALPETFRRLVSGATVLMVQTSVTHELWHLPWPPEPHVKQHRPCEGGATTWLQHNWSPLAQHTFSGTPVLHQIGCSTFRTHLPTNLSRNPLQTQQWMYKTLYPYTSACVRKGFNLPAAYCHLAACAAMGQHYMHGSATHTPHRNDWHSSSVYSMPRQCFTSRSCFTTQGRPCSCCCCRAACRLQRAAPAFCITRLLHSARVTLLLLLLLSCLCHHWWQGGWPRQHFESRACFTAQWRPCSITACAVTGHT
jgi:hypothetical protein